MGEEKRSPVDTKPGKQRSERKRGHDARADQDSAYKDLIIKIRRKSGGWDSASDRIYWGRSGPNMVLERSSPMNGLCTHCVPN
jgi:hypothetical protein